MPDGVVEPVLDAGQFAEHRVAANVQPRVVDGSQRLLDLIAGFDAALLVAGGDRRAGGEQPVRGLVPGPVEAGVQGATAVGERERVPELAVVRHDVGEVVAAACLQVDVADRVGELGGRRDVVAGVFEVTGRRFQPCREQESCRHARRAGAASPAASRAVMIRCTPRLSPRTTQAQPNPLTMREREQRVVRHAPGQRGVDVGALGPGEREVLGLVAAADTVGRRSGRVGEPPRRARRARPRSRPASAIASRANARMLSSSRYRTASSAVVVVDDHERTAGEATDDVDRGGRRHVERAEHGFDRGKRCTTGEGGERPQTALVVGEQQVVAPPDGRLEGSAAFRSAAGRVAQHDEAVVEATGDLLDRQRLGSRRGELDRQRQAVERTAQLVHRVARVADVEVRALGGGPAGEQLDRVVERQRRELEHGLTVDVERHLAGAQDPQPRGGVEQADRELGGGVDDVLAVVEDDQRRRCA